MRTTRWTTALLAVGLLALTGCGGDDATPDTAPAAADAAGDDEAPADDDGLTVVATEFAFEPGDLSLPADTDVDLTLENSGVVEHDIQVDDLDLHVHADPSETTTETVNLPAGTYEFYCSIPGHRSSGMEGTLTVG